VQCSAKKKKKEKLKKREREKEREINIYKLVDYKKKKGVVEIMKIK